MQIREISSLKRSSRYQEAPKSRKKFGGILILLLIFLGIFSVGHFSHASAKDTGNVIKSGFSGYCLDNYKDQNSAGNQVDIWGCNGQASQSWQISLTQISKPGNLCLDAHTTSSIDLASCDQSSNQVWIATAGQLYNPHFAQCLSAPSASDGQTLTLTACKQNKASTEFEPSIDLSNSPCIGTQGAQVACVAIKEWTRWEANPNQRMNYLTAYTGGAPYEEWCADFVSYIYKEAGHPFSNGNSDGWDENIADQIQNQGFDIHPAGSYIPKPGDVAYFDYNGGHVEIVITGGKAPTFIYGDSATIDPYINNGAMEAKALSNQTILGSVDYYMSPNSNT